MEDEQFNDVGQSSLVNLGNKNVEWDLSGWRWDGDQFLAIRDNYSKEIDFGVKGKGKNVLDKRKVIAVEDDELNDCNGGDDLTLNLFDYTREQERRNEAVQGGSANRVPCCQVEGCNTDLRTSKDYHRRHKVCEVHSKANSAMVNKVMQRFCQQCSRFHLLNEFDEGKRSCRRRLDGHNKRRRKSNPNTTTNIDPASDNQATNYLLITILQILSNLHSGTSKQSKDQELLSQLLKTLATLASSLDTSNLSGVLHALQDSQKPADVVAAPSGSPNGLTTNSVLAQTLVKEQALIPKLKPNTHTVEPNDEVDALTRRQNTEGSLGYTAERVKYMDFDLNSVYSDVENCCEVNENLGTVSLVSPSCILQNSNQSSPQHASGNSDSASAQSQSTLIGDSQSRTGRIVFKLFGKDPSDFPTVLRSQILDWLSRRPTDIESYIRPGCVIFTLYLHQAESAWEELCSDLSFNMNSLLCNSADSFWRTGWIYARIQQHISFIYNGKILLSTPRLLASNYHFEIVSVSPIAAANSSRVKFTVKGFNLAHSTGRLLCAFDGSYLAQEWTHNLIENGSEHEDFESLSFSCLLPNAMGRGTIEVEDESLSSCFFPFIVAKHDVCMEIQKIEDLIDASPFEEDKMNRKTRVLNFVNEMGWLLRRHQLKNSHSNASFSLKRFIWLITFAMDQEWCAVVKNLLDILFDETIIDTDGASPNEIALNEGLLHTAVRKNNRSMAEAMLRYKPVGCNNFLFRPDLSLGPTNLTPLHVAASVSGAESMLDALTDDPGQVGLEAWKNVQDSTGFSPEDYARARGHESYLELVQKKIDKQQSKNNAHIILDMPSTISKLQAFGFEKGNLVSCKLCSQQMMCRPPFARSFIYRPAMLSLVGIAAVCVCIGLLFKGPPEVSCVFPPFRWERLRYGSM